MKLMKIKYMVVGIVIGVLATAALTAGASTVYEKFTAVARPDYTLVVDGEKVALNTPPKTIEGATHLPLREMATILGKDVNFNSGTITLTTIEESEGDKMTTPATGATTKTETPKETTVSSEWISLRELAAIGVEVQVGPELNVMTISKGEQAIKIYTTDIVENQTIEASLVGDDSTVTVKSDKGFTYFKTSELREVGIID